MDQALGLHVRGEREARGWSERYAAAKTKGKVSNTHWGRFEKGLTPLTPLIRSAVALAFTWPDDWPEHPPPLTGSDDRSLAERLEEVLRRLAALERQVGEGRPPEPR